MTKKNIVLGLALAAMLPMAASADTVSDLQAQINALMAQLSAAKGTTVAPTTASCSYVFTKTLKKGMSDTEVMNLQKVLNMSADTQVAATGVGSTGNEGMYFGAATKAAVIKFQNKFASDILTPNGLSTGTGSVGAATRAKLNALCSAAATTPTGTTTTTNTTGQTTGLQGTSGSITLTDTTANTDTQAIQGSTNKIAAFKIEAAGSDVNLSNLKITAWQTNSTGSDRLPRYAQKVHVYMNGTEVGSADVANFTRNNETPYNTYTINLPLTGAVVKMGSANKTNFYIGFDTLSNLDSVDAANNTWNVTVSNIRYNDATGVTLNDNETSSAHSGFSFVKLGTSGNEKITLTSGSANPVAQNVKVSESATTKQVVLNEFRVKAEGSAMTFNKVNFTVTLNGATNLADVVNTLYVMKGSQQLGSLSVTGTGTAASYTINLDSDYTLAQDNTDTFQITADVNKQKNGSTPVYAQGTAVTVNIPSLNATDVFGGPTDVNGDKMTAANGTSLSGSAAGNAQTFYTQGVMASNFAATLAQSGGVSNGSTMVPGETYTISYHLKAFGNTYYIPKQAVWTNTTGSLATTTGLTFQVLQAGAAIATTGTTSVSVVPGSITSTANTSGNYFTINDGEDQVFTVSVTLNPNHGGAAGMYSIQLGQAGYTQDNTGSTLPTAYTFAPAQNFKSAEANVSTY